MESARRWIGFVCPDCRFVFRVPRDHDGVGLVCPSCRRMLKIPAPGDQAPPLVAPIKGSPQDRSSELQDEPGSRKKHRRKRSRKSGDHSWDHSQSSSRASLRQERRQMFWMLVGGGTLFALIVSAVLVAMLGGDEAAPPVAGKDPAAPASADAGLGSGLEPGAAAVPEWASSAFLAAAEPLAKTFLDARKTTEILPLVRNPSTAEARILAHYPDGVIDAPGLSDFNTERQVTRIGSLQQVVVRTGDFEDRLMTFAGPPGELRIDWESWVGWSEAPWETYIRDKPVTPKMFRVLLSPVEYYNFGFSDEGRFQSFRLESPDGSHALYGYAERGSVLEARLKPPPDQKKVALTLMLKFPDDAGPGNQVWIDQFIAEGWVLDPDAP